MSKQLKLRFQKLLKKADFVQADLEYHEELASDAKTEFAQEIIKQIQGMPKELKEKIAEITLENQQREDEKLRHAAMERDQESDIEESRAEPSDTDLAQSDHEVMPDTEVPSGDRKVNELKKIFHRIAAITHPDKVGARGAGPREALRLEKLFKKSRQAYNDKNWYVLYSIALELDLAVDDPTKEQLEWLEDDIRHTMSVVSRIGSTIAWMWYSGNETIKAMAISNYFEQAFGISLGPIQMGKNGIIV